MSTNSSLKKITIVLAVVILVLITISLLSYFFLGKIIKGRLIDQVYDQTNGTYSLSIEDLDIDIFSGDATAKEIRLKPDTLKIRKSNNFNDFYEVAAPEISISGMKLWQLLTEKRVDVAQLRIVKPQVEWTRNFKRAGVDDSDGQNDDKENLPPVYIDKILLDESGLRIFENNNSTPVISLDKASFRVDEFQIIDDTTEQLNRRIDFDDLTLSVKDYTMKLPDSLNTLHFDSLRTSVKHATLMVNGIDLQPRYGRYEYSRKKGVETDRMEFYNKEIFVKGLDFKRFKQENKIIASLIVIDSINVVLYRDKTHPVKPTEKKKLIQQTIREAPVYLLIDSLQLNDAQITYQEKVEEETKPGNINFVNLQASVSNITNDSIMLQEGAIMTASAQTYIMGVGKLQADFNFSLGAVENYHSIKGTASSMQMEVINPMLQYVAFAEVQSGTVNQLNFEVKLNENTSTGSMEFFYEDLKIDLLNKGEKEGKKGLVSFFANTFIIKKANPLNEKFRPGQMYFERDKNKSMINFWWKSLLSGLKDSMGLPSDKPDDTTQK